MSGTVHTTSKELENGSFTLKTHQMFFVHNTPEKCEKHINKRYLRKTGAGKSVDYPVAIFFENSVFRQNVFSPRENARPAFQIPPV